MAEVISMCEHPSFDCVMAGCVQCDGDDFKVLLSPDGDLNVIGFQCSTCHWISVFTEEDIKKKVE